MDWKPASRKRALTAEEAELWAYVMRDAKVLPQDGRDDETISKPPENGKHPASASPAPGSGIAASPVPRPPEPPPRAPIPTQPKAPPLAAFDEKERRRLGKNPDLIDARLDLHGYRQREAHEALRSFLLSCAARGHRHVLIITGKGTVAERQRDFYGEERGVLRRLVPQWLGDPQLRGLVVSYSTSHMRHGGEGALYVRLRRSGAR